MIYAKIKEEIKEAMRDKNNVKRDTLKMVLDKARNIQKNNDPMNTYDDISDEVMIQAINKEIKQLQQTKDALSGRENSVLFIETVNKIAILCGYLPVQMTREEVEQAVSELLSGCKYENFGIKMKVCMSELKGKADNKLIKEVVENYK